MVPSKKLCPIDAEICAVYFIARNFLEWACESSNVVCLSNTDEPEC